MKFRIIGSTMQALDIMLNRGEAVFTEGGGMSWYKGAVNMETNMPGGMLGGLGRELSGESLFMTEYTAMSEQALITFTPEVSGSIIARELAAGETVIAQRDAFMVAQKGVSLAVHFQKRLGAGFFGGEGFIMQKVTGPGYAFFEIDGETVEMNLAAGEKVMVDPGHVALMDATVGYDIERIKGVKNIIFGGEGLFLATVTGPGKVVLQTMPFSNLLAKIIAKIPKSS